MKMKFKFSVKDFDYKQFFLSYGEWIGLAVALVITLSVLFSGVAKIFGSGNPTSNANAVNELAAKVERDIQTSPVPEKALQPNRFGSLLRSPSPPSGPASTISRDCRIHVPRV